LYTFAIANFVLRQLKATFYIQCTTLHDITQRGLTWAQRLANAAQAMKCRRVRSGHQPAVF
jgi:hypothetical protein